MPPKADPGTLAAEAGVRLGVEVVVDWKALVGMALAAGSVLETDAVLFPSEDGPAAGSVCSLECSATGLGACFANEEDTWAFAAVFGAGLVYTGVLPCQPRA